MSTGSSTPSDEEERYLVGTYLEHGQTVIWMMGFSICRPCGIQDGNAEMTDGHNIWPEGLAHYVTEHDVRLPREFVEHVLARDDEPIERHSEWWSGRTLGT